MELYRFSGALNRASEKSDMEFQNRNIINIALSVPSFSGDPVHVEIAMIQADGLDGDPIQTYGVGGSDNYSGFFVKPAREDRLPRCRLCHRKYEASFSRQTR